MISNAHVLAAKYYVLDLMLHHPHVDIIESRHWNGYYDTGMGLADTTY